MKTGLHPKWYDDCQVSCACGNSFIIGNTVPSIKVEICGKCHPFYTGQMKFVDTAGRVDAFKAKQGKAVSGKVISKSLKRLLKKEKKMETELARPESLSELRKQNKKK